MAGTFETPHPTLEANSQVYKLPSTKPIPSPTPFSPVPSTKTLDLRPRSYFIPTTSGGLKENAGSSKSLRRQSSKTLSSFTLTSGSGPASRGAQTRSPSRSSNSASSRSRSRDQKRFSKYKAKLIKKSKFKPNSSINDLSEHHPSKSRESSFSRSRYFTKRNKSILLVSNAEQTLLASPFASRAPSPSNIDIVKSGWNESMGPPAPVNHKLDAHSQDLSVSKKGRLSQDCDSFSPPKKPGTRKRSSARSFDRQLGITNENDFSWKNRRPSAPSNLQRPSKPVGKSHTPAKRTAKTGRKQFKEENLINSHTSDHRKSALSHSVDLIKDCNNQLGVGMNYNPDPFFWMQERSAVDFNRPPSQLSLHLSSAFIPTEDDTEAEDVFWSSGEDNDSDNDHLNQRLDARLEATNPILLTSTLLTSTPYKEVIARRRRVPILEGPSIVLPKSGGSMSASSKIEVSVADTDKSGEDMELTAPLDCGGNPGKDSMSFQEHTPWITDSIISPPTAYSERKKPAVNVENVKKEEYLVFAEPGLRMSSPSSTMVPTQAGVLSSPFRSPFAESTSSMIEPAPFGLHELVVGNQEPKVDIVTDGTEDKGITVQPQRTRSGTILGGRNTIARRTRSGTIVGPSTIGRTRSGTIVAKVKIPEQNVAVVGNRRIRSGSVIGPDPSVSKGVRSSNGSEVELEPMSISNAVGADEGVHEIVGGELTQIESTCNGNRIESSIKEVNEAECFIDSLYLTSSPDPIDFLTGAKIDGDESALVGAVGDWQVVDGPPSPDLRRTKKPIQTPRGVGSRPITRRFKSKGRRARFLGIDGQVEGCELDTPRGTNLNFEDDTSDDELLLVEGQSQSLFG